MPVERTANILADEGDLVRAAQGGDRDAFAQLVSFYRLKVIDVVYRMCGNSSLAEDAAQIAFLRVWQHLPGFQAGSSFRNWLYRIAVNAALDMLRREKPQTGLDVVELPDRAEKPEARVEQQEQAQRVRRAVLALPEASRVVLVLREYQGLSYHEIAETLELPVGTVMSRLNYARTKLMSLLSSELEER